MYGSLYFYRPKNLKRLTFFLTLLFSYVYGSIDIAIGTNVFWSRKSLMFGWCSRINTAVNVDFAQRYVITSITVIITSIIISSSSTAGSRGVRIASRWRRAVSWRRRYVNRECRLVGEMSNEIVVQVRQQTTARKQQQQRLFIFLPEIIHNNIQGSYNRSGETGKSLGIWLVMERSGGNIFGRSERMKNWCHQMSDFQDKMHQIRFPLGLRPRPRWGSLQRSPRLPISYT